MRRFQCYIDGRFEDGEASFSSLDPATGEPWAEMPESREADISRAVEAAHRALYDDAAWSKLTATQRGKLLYRLADLVAENAKTLAELETRDTGKIIRETSAQIAYVADYYRYYAGLADKIEGAYLPIDKPDMDVWLRREPVGVVAAIVPWNSQLFLAAVKIGPALAAGCTIVIKASEDGPAPLLEFARLVQEAGFPAGVVNIVTGFGASCGTALTTHPKVAHIAFTGGPETARHIVRNSAENLASTSLELGGKSPILVFADADLESAANAQVAGIFAATGQSCVAGSRLIVERSVKDRFLGILKAKAEAIRIGSPLDMATEVGPLATERQRKHIVSLVSASEKAGAKVVTGGLAVDCAGYFYPPTILDCDGIRSPSMEREFFGPVLSVVSFETEAEAIALANDTVYGLASGVFTQNLTRAHRLMKAIRAGVVWVNTYRAVSPIAPFGGFGLSGDGREGGLAAALDYTRTKTIWLRTSDDPIPDPFVMR
ncbi:MULTISPECIES: aldehyde dehydrogenase [Rhizobium/Agrobacterium group]|uniref:Aldehyde dehydrogenase n=1 Tax=Agrobacterium tumefaciens TaxID=358 RepID=A0AAJ4TBM3_AGRTU|nr:MULTISPECIES: aldehyde dehydrogenase [Rhizobium/Agrobacterium group]KAA3527794.1 aldehyde dehydrogenase [Agrobacterium tumefaciens]MBO9110814.1 aldehyde dehydrogenase [Agrobacterium sp. S2/73]MDP9758154.1 acyl-CoA reductase-like NAD-dependent aldehyde dehydrogenase [Agrobacterium tumefaciens]MDQ1219395.1 acyl-CoA reductase-like NAD-dependent aldehyde dehydrogenase [Agrobacterium sp. SORGH_AS_0745]MEA1842898.1 aldehyde dehydrogenase [Agrobacterium tumefaciens]